MCAQVCRRWKQVLTDPRARGELWREVIIDFGHELITAVRQLALLQCPPPARPSYRPCACLLSGNVTAVTLPLRMHVAHSSQAPHINQTLTPAELPDTSCTLCTLFCTAWCTSQ